MHRKHLLPGFDDRTSDEAAINNLTQEITDVINWQNDYGFSD